MAKLIFADGTTITLEEVELPLEIPISVKLTLAYESGISKLPDPDCFAVQDRLLVALQLASQPRASGVVYSTPNRPLPVP